MPQLLKDKFIESLLEFVEAADVWEIEQEIQRTERKMAVFFRLQGKLFLKEFAWIANFFQPVVSEAVGIEAVSEAAGDEAELLFDKVAAQTAAQGGKALEKGIAKGAQVGYNALADELGIGMAWSLPDERAIEYARVHAAKAVTNVNATTKKRIGQIVTYGLEENETYDEVARTINNSFKEFAIGKPQEHIKSRGHLCAVTEMGNAREDGGRQLVDEIQAVGIKMEKSRGGPRDDKTSAGCLRDLDAGWIPEDQAFPSGIQHGLRFPGCRHHTNYQVADVPEGPPPQVAKAKAAKKAAPTIPRIPRPPKITKAVKPPKQITPEQWAKELTAQERTAMQMWQHTSYGEIRAYERAGEISSAATKDMVRFLHNTLDKAPQYKGTVYRGIYNLDDDAYRALAKSGQTMTFDASTSASMSQEIAKDFGNMGERGRTILFKIKTKTGIDVDGASATGFIREQEVILRKGTKYRITDIKELGDIGEVPGINWTEIALMEI